MKSVLDFKKS